MRRELRQAQELPGLVLTQVDGKKVLQLVNSSLRTYQAHLFIGTSPVGGGIVEFFSARPGAPIEPVEVVDGKIYDESVVSRYIQYGLKEVRFLIHNGAYLGVPPRTVSKLARFLAGHR